jgi:TolB protein
VVANDLESSGLFQPLDRASFLEAVRDINQPPRMVDWRSTASIALHCLSAVYNLRCAHGAIHP